MSFSGFKAIPLNWTQVHDAQLHEALMAHPVIEEWVKFHQALASHTVVTGMLTEDTPAQQIQVIAHDKGCVSMTMKLLSDLDRIRSRGANASEAADG